MPELKSFEDELFELVKNIQFKPANNRFQTELKQNIKKVHATNKIIVKGDKSRNLYQLPVEQYRKLVRENVTKDYKTSSLRSVQVVNKEAKTIATTLEIEDRVDKFVESDAFITVKDHKVNFPSKPEYRLINPAKSNLGMVSKQILEKVVNHIRSQLELNLWKNTDDVITWFEKTDNKHCFKFFKFDIVSSYPTILF